MNHEKVQLKENGVQCKWYLKVMQQDDIQKESKHSKI